jgi:hypothetical protein
MKEHITPKQANQLTKAQFYDLFPEGLVSRVDWATYHRTKLTVGKMVGILKGRGYSLKMVVASITTLTVYNTTDEHTFCSPNLCDTLWEAIVHVVKTRG